MLLTRERLQKKITTTKDALICRHDVITLYNEKCKTNKNTTSLGNCDPLPAANYAKEISKRSFISTVRLTVHTNPSRKRSFSKTLFKPEEFENAGFAFSCGQKTFWKQSFSKTMTSR